MAHASRELLKATTPIKKVSLIIVLHFGQPTLLRSAKVEAYSLLVSYMSLDNPSLAVQKQ